MRLYALKTNLARKYHNVKKTLDNAAAGDYLFATPDGTLYAISAKEVCNPQHAGECIGVVFSMQPTAYDKAHGVRHGYALAVNDAASACRWADEAAWHRKTLFWHRAPKSRRLQLPDNLLCREGLRNSMLMNGDTDYPAFHAAGIYGRDFGHKNPVFTFLPSAGQWIEILSSLAAPCFAAEAGVSLTKGCWSAEGKSISEAINRKLRNVPGALPLCNGVRDIFWSSTPAGSKSAYGLAFYEKEGIAGICAFPASTRCRVRAVIAF